mmetsp:Transcript_32933/g.97195  ORF Transcript_32933/g.97195 Transcript_32933/m.97195 type:complete len:171 (+) Transcript_32933:208-720(+)
MYVSGSLGGDDESTSLTFIKSDTKRAICTVQCSSTLPLSSHTVSISNGKVAVHSFASSVPGSQKTCVITHDIDAAAAAPIDFIELSNDGQSILFRDETKLLYLASLIHHTYRLIPPFCSQKTVPTRSGCLAAKAMSLLRRVANRCCLIMMQPTIPSALFRMMLASTALLG